MAKKDTLNQALLSGNEALARGAYEAGLKVACAYPGTPSTEILEVLSEYPEVDTQWSVNEKVAFEVAMGAATAGVRSLFACKHVGLNVAMDPLMTASYTGILAGFVIVVCDDPGMHSSQNEQDTRWVALYSKIPMLEPSSPAEAREFVKEAFAMSERFDTPVMLRMTTRISHTKENVSVGERKVPEPPIFERNAPKYVMVPGHAYQRHIFVEQRLVKLAALAEKTRLNRIEKGDGKLGFVVSGVTYQYVKENYPDASYLKLGMSYPFCDEKIRRFAKSVKKLVVVEELDPFLEDHIKTLGVKVAAKDPSFRIGELTPELIPDVVAGKAKVEQRSAKRKPRLCPECPHWASFAALKKLDAYVAGDIGCYTLACLPPMSALHSCVCMGAGVTFHEGWRKAAPNKPIVGVLGDSTFVHSGITGLINAAYNKCKGVILILDNSTTAMTGGQQHPATGLTIRNEPTKKLILEDVCRACGADNVDVVDPKNLEEFRAILEKRINEDALSVVISRHPCKLIKKKVS
ncbi:MAG TPA: thiamine pyrophosphate-dependent enzyme [Sedimentisphaerales bacterium]|nr:thiamine pyrophosphate-dependent enzyme [Sedimentisphaerales bacterium]